MTIPSTNYGKLSVSFSLCLLALCLFSAVNQPVSLAQSNGVFTDAQAVRGQALYDSKCGKCHGNQLF